jgi:transcription initiation factor TFIID subunit 11
MHPLRQTSFPSSENTDPRVFSATSAKSDAEGAGSVTGSFTGSLGGTSVDGKGGGKQKKGKGKVGRPSKKDKERERAEERERDRERQRDGEGTGSVRASVVDGSRGSMDPEGSSVRGGRGGVAGADDVEDEIDVDDGEEGDLSDGEEPDMEAEKKNLAYVPLFFASPCDI